MPVLKSETRIKQIDTTSPETDASEYASGDVVYDQTDGLVHHNGSSFEGIQAKFLGMHIEKGIVETLRQNGLATQGGEAYMCDKSQVCHHKPDGGDVSAGNWQMNLYNFSLPINSATCITVIAEQSGNAYRPDTLYISPNSSSPTQQTLVWAGGTAPTPTPNGIDVFSFTIYRLSLDTYTVLGQMVSFGG